MFSKITSLTGSRGVTIRAPNESDSDSATQQGDAEGDNSVETPAYSRVRDSAPDSTLSTFLCTCRTLKHFCTTQTPLSKGYS
ncbi:hypothetical protein E2C01_047591 [Portunus trituberculatus]|uniref:Uncharacterized protein n=1 Tax=Portunus trituberculatus TaxID=210409 RepID=A0A5B7G8Z0_PORTR|nr:hypothetical protein [Portunus trituberculatus]